MGDDPELEQFMLNVKTNVKFQFEMGDDPELEEFILNVETENIVPKSCKRKRNTNVKT